MAHQVQLFGMNIDAVRMNEAVAQILAWVGEPASECRYVVTPNVDHAVMFQEREDLRQSYQRASMVLADGFPLVAASRLLRRSLPERVAGSDLAPALFAAGAPLRLFLLGAAPGVAEHAAHQIETRWPHVTVVGTYSPPLGFESDEFENRKMLDLIAAARPDVLMLGLGAPKQELWVHKYQQEIAAKVVLCAGATIDFLAGHRRRAPRWMRSAGLEWLHRLAGEPRRLCRRYARDAWIFPRLVLRELHPAS